MQVEIRYFASLKDQTGCTSESIEVETAADVECLWGLLVERHPGLGKLGFRPMVACDLVYAEWDRSLEGVREVAFLPPVSGG